MSFTTASASVEHLVDHVVGGSMTVLAVWAHPDDETYLGGGLMAEVARRGGRVVSVTATAGEHGTADPVAHPPEQLRVRRESELQRALTVLGAAGPPVLGFGDGACDRIADGIGARRIGSVIDETRPDVVLTFGLDGVTGHPDHRAVARWTHRAVAERGNRIPVLTTAAGAVWPAELLDRMHGIGAFWPGYPQRTISGPTWTVRLDGALLEQKMAALACHGSQIGPLQDALGAGDYRLLASVEAYRAANPAAVRRSHPGRRSSAA